MSIWTRVGRVTLYSVALTRQYSVLGLLGCPEMLHHFDRHTESHAASLGQDCWRIGVVKKFLFDILMYCCFLTLQLQSVPEAETAGSS